MQHKIELPTLFKLQEEIVDDPARFKVLVCGRRFGKTQIGLEIIANHLFEGHAVAYFAPSQIMTTEVWETVKVELSPLISRVKELDFRMEFSNGGLLECWTARTEAVRGRNYHTVIIDEAALIPDATLWQSVIRPLLTDHQGTALFASTPRGRNWFWDLYNRGQDPTVKEWKSWTFPTSENPYIEDDEIEQAKNDLPQRVFEQEYLAQFLETGGTVFRGLDKVCTAQPIPKPDPNQRYVFGVDWGRDRDFTAISIMDDTGTQVALERFNQVSYIAQRDKLKRLYERYRPVKILAEANSIGTVNIESLIRDNLPVRPFQTTAESKPKLIDTLTLAIEKQEITLLNNATLMHELSNYQMTRSPYGSWQFNAPPGGHDDTVIATALSLWAHLYHRSLNIAFA